jgi:ComF family protein
MRFRLTAPFAPPVLQTAWESMLRLVYPNTCAGCNGLAADHRLPLCTRCLGQVERADIRDVAAQLERLPLERGNLETTFALWRFEEGGALQKVHHLLKYGNRPAYGIALGKLIGEELRGLHPEGSVDLIVPVPLHAARFYERGYNQSTMLASGASFILQTPVCEGVLRRTRSTRTQTRLSREERWANVQEAFQVKLPGEVRGRRILLIDDVLTTGATIACAAQALRGAGAASVSIAVLAYAQI